MTPPNISHGLSCPFTVAFPFAKMGEENMRTYKFRDGYTKEVEGYLDADTIAELENKHGLMYSVTTGNQEVLCGHARNI